MSIKLAKVMMSTTQRWYRQHCYDLSWESCKLLTERGIYLQDPLCTTNGQALINYTDIERLGIP